MKKLSKRIESLNKIQSCINNFEKRLDIITKNSIFTLSIIGIIGLIIRFCYFPYGLPITHDGDLYFSYALDTSILGRFPDNYVFPNNGWPAFLSLFFSIMKFEHVLDYMNLQRVLTISISVLTLIPIYLLCKKFFGNLFSIFGASLFILDPRVIQNSLLGITEPLYILLLTTSLYLFLSSDRKIVHYGFWVAALASIIRNEGLLLLVPFSIVYFIRFRNDRMAIPKYFFVITIFVLILLPMAYLRIETTGHDGFTNITFSANYLKNTIEASNDAPNKLAYFIINGISGLVKFGAWSLIPQFIFFVPLGLVMLFKKLDFKKITLILASFVLLLPAFYVYSREIQEIRYLFQLYPIFCILSLFTVQKLDEKSKKPKSLTVVLLIGIILSSLMFLQYNAVDYEHERDALGIAYDVYNITDGINDYEPEFKYLNFVRYTKVENFPVLTTSSLLPKLNFIAKSDFGSIDEYIQYGKENGLTHLVLDGHNAIPPLLNDVFFNESNYPYTVKVYDSLEHGYNYHVKIFKIDYQLFEKLKTR